ncbi:hypothetical protein [Enterococcus thailandicus]
MNTFTIKDWITVGISFIALLISMINLLRDQKHINLRISKQGLIKRIETYDAELAFPEQQIGVSIDFRFLNSSKHSIGYYDLVFKDGYTKELLPCTYKFALRPEIAKQELLGITISDQVAHLNFMDSNYGVIPANSYIFKEVIVYPKSEKIRVNIKFAKYSLIPNFHSKTTKFRKWKSQLIKLNSEETSILQKQSEELQSQEMLEQ